MILIIVISCDLFNVALVSPVEARSKWTSRSKKTFRSNIYLEGPVYSVNIKPEDQWSCKRSPDILA